MPRRSYYSRRRNKYHAIKKSVDGIVFDSVKEANRYMELQEMLRSGTIKDLRRQVKYLLIPVQRAPSTVGKRGGVKVGAVIERECSYIADFVYTVTDTNQVIVEDTKGMRTKDYVIKRKLMLFVYGIKVKEI